MILLTGASGFVGGALLRRLQDDMAATVKVVSRSPFCTVDGRVQSVLLDRPLAEFDWTPSLQGVQTVVHAAARVHVMRDRARDPLAEFRAVNVQGTLALARAAAAAGARRFVMVSTLKVLGERSAPGAALGPTDAPHPVDPYGVSKHEAEQGLRELSADTGIEVVIVRPPLVYGPGVGANFRAMMRWVALGRPLPLGAIRGNRRSLVAVDNLVDLLLQTISHPAAAGQVLHVTDGEDMSTTELLERLGRALGRPARLIPVPPAALRLAAGLCGLGPQIDRLLGSLQSDISATRSLLGWSPPVSVEAALQRTADAYRHEAVH